MPATAAAAGETAIEFPVRARAIAEITRPRVLKANKGSQAKGLRRAAHWEKLQMHLSAPFACLLVFATAACRSLRDLVATPAGLSLACLPVLCVSSAQEHLTAHNPD